MGAAIAGLVQGISGFAFAMVAMSIWVWGIVPLIAAPMAVFGGWFGQVISAIRVRRGWYVSILWPFVVGSAIGIPIGTKLLGLLDRIDSSWYWVRCWWSAVRRCWPPRASRKSTAAAGWPMPAWPAGGVMAPLSGFSGLAPALWCTLRGYNKDEHRAVLQNFNLIVLSATLATNVWTGRVRGDHWPQMAVVAGSLVLPAIWGSKILRRHERGGVPANGVVAAGVRGPGDAGRGIQGHDVAVISPRAASASGRRAPPGSRKSTAGGRVWRRHLGLVVVTGFAGTLRCCRSRSRSR